MNLEQYFKGWVISSVLILGIALKVIAENCTHTNTVLISLWEHSDFEITDNP